MLTCFTQLLFNMLHAKNCMRTIKYQFVNMHVSQTWIGKLHYVLTAENKCEYGN